ncbi:hypothetical protein LCM10_06615 [Rossellomorea aquimaris]|uniref:YphA family membrane protein n=1 Tax=Rossellomorea aquimaris TaxID=189382 RepID=UPI001CD1A406|nr:hypothetical protein [Rossellomorea aquimaris]MCA1054654.1 hypothetical protein [Rossellomorea aquimaris]
MDGFLFLWVAWALWIYMTFIMGKHTKGRFMYSFIVLSMICLFPYHITIHSYVVHLTTLLLAMIAILHIRNDGLRKKLYMLVCAMTIGMSYAGVGMIAIYDPVLMIIDSHMITAFLSMSIGFLFYGRIDQLRSMFLSVLVGSLMGEMMLSISLSKIGFVQIIGGPVYLDILAYMILTTLAWKFIHSLNSMMGIKLSPNKGEIKNI